MSPYKANISRAILAATLSVLGFVLIGAGVPYNSFIFGGSLLADAQLPVAAFAVALFIVFVINPLLRLAAPGMALRTRELALVFGILMVASVPTSTGLHRNFPYGLTETNLLVSRDSAAAERYGELNPPASLFPEELAYGQEARVAEDFADQLPEGESIPWAAWLRPMLSWGALYGPWAILMLGLALMVLPQWRDNERLPFPMLAVQRALAEKDDGDFFPRMFKRRFFWAGFLIVFIGWHLPGGVNALRPGTLPKMPMSWEIMDCCQDGILRHTPWFLQFGQIFFIFLGMGFLMPGRIGFSIWFMQVLYGVAIIIGSTVAPPFNYAAAVAMHQTGAFLTLPVFTVWLGRKHWVHVFRVLVGLEKPGPDGLRERVAGGAFVIGAVGILGWLIWVGVNPLWAVGLLVLAILFTLAIMRVVAETGIPLIAGSTNLVTDLAGFLPTAWRSAASMYFTGVIARLAGDANRICASSVLLHAVATDDKSRPRDHARLGMIFAATIIGAAVFAGAVHLYMNYNHATINTGPSFLDVSDRLLDIFRTGRPIHEISFIHLLVGIGIAALLQRLCLASPSWPLHPLPLLFVTSWYAQQLFSSVFVGWLIKVLVLRYGGSRAYEKAYQFFIGVIVAELFAVLLWTLVGIILSLTLGIPFKPYSAMSSIV